MRYIVHFVYEYLEAAIACTLLVLLVIILSIQVLFRYVFLIGLDWTEETARFCFVWMIYMGASLAALQARHIRIEIHLKWLGPRLYACFMVLSDLLWVSYNLILVWVGFKLAYRMIFQLPYISPTLGWNLGYVYMVIPLGFLLMTFRVIQARYRILRGRLASSIGAEV